MPPIIVRVASPQQPRPVIVTPSRQIPAAPSPPRRQRYLHVKLNPQPRPPGPFFMNITVMVDPPPRPPQRIIVNYADSPRQQPSRVQPSPVQVSPPQVIRTIDISPAASPVVIHPDLPVPGVISRSNGSLRRKESARARTGGLPVVMEMDRPNSQSGIAISPEVVMLERPRSWAPPPPPLVERVDPGLFVVIVLAGCLRDCGGARRSTNHRSPLFVFDWSTSPPISFTLLNSLLNSLSVTMQQPGSSALGLISNQLVINIGPDPRIPPPLADPRQPVFIRFGPSPPPNLTRSQPKVPTIPVTVRFTPPRRSRQQRRPPPTPVDVPIPIVPEISPGTIPKTGTDLLTPHPTVVPSPFMGTVITSETSRTPKPTIIRLPNFNSPPQRDGIDPPRAPPFVRATARMPPPARPEKETTVIRVPEEAPPTPIIVRIQSPLGSPRVAQQSLPVRTVTLHVRAPEPSVRSPSRVFARLKNEGSVGSGVGSNNG